MYSVFGAGLGGAAKVIVNNHNRNHVRAFLQIFSWVR